MKTSSSGEPDLRREEDNRKEDEKKTDRGKIWGALFKSDGAEAVFLCLTHVSILLCFMSRNDLFFSVAMLAQVVLVCRLDRFRCVRTNDGV